MNLPRPGVLRRGSAHTTRCLCGSLVLILLLGALPVSASDLILRSRVSVSNREAPSQITQYWTAKRLVEDLERMRILVDLEARTVTVIHKSAKTYEVRTFEDFHRLGEEAAKQLEQTRKQLAEMSPEARIRMPAMARAMAAMAEIGPPGPAWTLKRTGRSERIAGHDAQEISISAGPIHGAAWVASKLQPPFNTEDIAALRAATRGMPRFGLNPIDLFELERGVLLRSELTLPEPGGLTVTMDVVEVKKEAPPAEIVGVPAGFTRGTGGGASPAD
jgi:hypothetical protein